MLKQESMYIDCHVHSYPTIVEGGTFRPFQGVSWESLETRLKDKERETGVKHGVFYGPHHASLLRQAYEKDWAELSTKSRMYLGDRVLPMLENHRLQTLGVLNLENLEALYRFDESRALKNQIEAINFIAYNGGISIIDLPQAHKEKSQKDGVFRNLKGAATIDDLAGLPDGLKEKTFLCYNSMEPNFKLGPLDYRWRDEAERVSRETGIGLLGGSDAIGSPESMFGAYSEAGITDMSKLLENPGFLEDTDLHKENVPGLGRALFKEQGRRWFVGKIIETLGQKWRSGRIERLLEKWADKHQEDD